MRWTEGGMQTDLNIVTGQKTRDKVYEALLMNYSMFVHNA